MLTKRTNILFDEKQFQDLKSRAKQEKISVGELVRRAVRKAYIGIEGKEKDEATEAFERILKIRKVSKTPIDYKALINYGRKF